MIGVVGIGISRQAAVGAHAGPFVREDEVTRPFAQVQPGARGVERAAGFPVEHRERVEAVERETAEGIRAPGHHIVGHAAPEQQGAGDDGVCGRRAGRADRRRVTSDAAVAGDPLRAVGTVVPRHVAQPPFRLVRAEVAVEILRQIHAAYRGARDECYARPGGDRRIRYGLCGRRHAQQGGAGGMFALRDAEQLPECRVVPFHFAHGHADSRTEKRRLPDSAASGAQVPERLPGSDADGRDDPYAADGYAHCGRFLRIKSASVATE